MRSVEYPELTPRSKMRQQRRINRSMGDGAYEGCIGLKDNLVTHKDKNPVSVRFPTFRHLLVFFRSHFHIHRENGTRAINEVSLSRSCVILH